MVLLQLNLFYKKTHHHKNENKNNKGQFHHFIPKPKTVSGQKHGSRKAINTTKATRGVTRPTPTYESLKRLNFIREFPTELILSIFWWEDKLVRKYFYGHDLFYILGIHASISLLWQGHSIQDTCISKLGAKLYTKRRTHRKIFSFWYCGKGEEVKSWYLSYVTGD